MQDCLSVGIIVEGRRRVLTCMALIDVRIISTERELLTESRERPLSRAWQELTHG